ncbi:MAG: PH domain-containing protein [Verrucomicrobiota bacterium]|nr:PH domain-containing protein [Verrucomicrobiota bacterium]
MQFYIYLNGTQRGPFSEDQVRNYLAAGLVHSADLASASLEGNLQPLTLLLDRDEAVDVPSPPVPPVTITPPPRDDLPPLSTDSLGPYARTTLAPNETPFYRTSLHWIVFVRFALLALGAFVLIAMPFAIAVQALTGSQLGWFALPLPACIMIAPTLAYIGSELVITNVRVLIKTGVVRRQSLEMFISKIESVAIDQSFLGRLFDYGTVVVRGTGGFAERFETIAHPIQFRSWVQRMQKTAGPVAEPGRLT